MSDSIDDRLDRIERILKQQQGYGVYDAIERLIDSAISYLNEKVIVSQMKRKRASMELPGGIVQRDHI